MAPPTRSMSAWSYKHWCTHAELLASIRADCWCDTQLVVIDRLVERFAHIYSEDAPVAFDPVWFCQKARRFAGRQHDTLILEDQHHEQRQSDHRHRQPHT